MMSMTDFKLVSLNVRGLRSLNKRKAILTWLIKQKADIVFLQETGIVRVKMKIFGIRSGRAKCYFRTAQIIVRALLIVKQGLDFEQKSVLCDPNDRFIILEAVYKIPRFCL